MKKTKHLISYFLLLLSLPTQAEIVEIFDIQKTELDGAFSLISDVEEVKITLDCASFIHNMTIKEKDKTYFFYMSEQECMEDLKSVIKVPEVRKCLNYNESEYLISDCGPD